MGYYRVFYTVHMRSDDGNDEYGTMVVKSNSRYDACDIVHDTVEKWHPNNVFIEDIDEIDEPEKVK